MASWWHRRFYVVYCWNWNGFHHILWYVWMHLQKDTRVWSRGNFWVSEKIFEWFILLIWMDRRRQGRAVKELENLFVIVWVMLSFYGIEKAATKDIHWISPYLLWILTYFSCHNVFGIISLFSQPTRLELWAPTSI